MSYADDFTEEKLLELEKKINKVYSDAQKDLEKQAKDYFEQFAKRDEEYKKLVDSGEITENDYKQWRLNQIGRGERMNKMAANMAARATQANEVAMAYVNDATPTVYSLNRNHEAYVIEQLGHDMTVGGDFTLYNKSSVRRMLVKNPEVMPYYPEEKAVARGIDLEYGQKVIKAKTTSGILQGKSVYKIADDLQRDITNMNRVSAVRAARTAITSAQNGGRQDTMLAAQKMGIKLRKRWVSAKDGRVRDAHGAADGQTVNVDEPFIVGGEKLMFPGDKTAASGWNLYNCRCGMRTVEKEGIEAEQRQVRIQNPKYTEAVENEEKAKARYERAKAKEDAETDPEKKKALRKDRLEKQKEYEHYSSIRKGTQKNIVVNGDMTYEEWEKLRGKTISRNPQNVVSKPTYKKPQFIPAKTVEEAELYAKRFSNNVSYGKMTVKKCNEVNQTLDELTAKYPISTLDKIEVNPKLKSVASANWRHLDINPSKIGSSRSKTAWQAELKENNAELARLKHRLETEKLSPGLRNNFEATVARLEREVKYSRYGLPDDYGVKGTVVHEYGHILADQYTGQINGTSANPNYSQDLYNPLYRKNQKINDTFTKAKQSEDIYKISNYASKNSHEFFAECFTMREMGEELPDYINEMLDEVLKNGVM